MIPTLKTNLLLEEIPTDGHSPMQFICNDGNIYYCKYRTQYKIEEIDCLVYEMVCSELLKRLNIPTPQIALIEIIKDTYDIKKLNANKRYIQPGIVCFGSKHVNDSMEIIGIQSISNKPQTHKFEDIYDLLRIAMFDLWVDNDDRGKGSKENYNLLFKAKQVKLEDSLKTVTKYQWLAFDHAFVFGGRDKIRIFNKTMLPCLSCKLIESNYFNYFKKYFNPAIYNSIIENFVSLCSNEIEDSINYVFTQIPPDWQIPISLSDRMISFLSDEIRLRTVKQLTIHSLKRE
jgi:hypothetical protein